MIVLFNKITVLQQEGKKKKKVKRPFWLPCHNHVDINLGFYQIHV